jgi:hypothetical protein
MPLTQRIRQTLHWGLRQYGLALGFVALAATGVGAFADAGILGAGVTAETVSTVASSTAIYSGAGAAVIDSYKCAEGDTNACAGAVAGIGGLGYGAGAKYLGLTAAQKVAFGAVASAFGGSSWLADLFEPFPDDDCASE